jgi:hypothetical protein
MSPRIIHIPLSGGDRKAQAKGIRYAHGIHNSYFKESVLIRSAAEAKIREADLALAFGPQNAFNELLLRLRPIQRAGVPTDRQAEGP